MDSGWLLWALFAFIPTLIITTLGIRTIRVKSSDSKADYSDILTLSNLITPFTILLACSFLPANKLSSIELAVCFIIPLAAYDIIKFAVGTRVWWDRRLFTGILSRDFFHLTICAILPLLCISVFILLYAWIADEKFSLLPGFGLFIGIYISLIIASKLIDRITSSKYNWKQIAPCELYDRIQQIAQKAESEVNTVYVYNDRYYLHLNASAYSSDSIVFSESLISRLSKDEVDAVAAHEIGHAIDRKFWRYYYSYQWTILLFIVVAIGCIEKTLSSYPEAYAYLHFVGWIIVILAANLLTKWQSRKTERKAIGHASVAVNPEAAISGYFRLKLINNLALDRPWWSKILPTHPTFKEEINQIAVLSGLSESEVFRILEETRSSLENDAVKHYEPVYYLPSAENIVKRSVQRTIIPVIPLALGTACLYCRIAYSILVKYPLPQYLDWMAVIIYVGGAGTISILLPILFYVRLGKALRQRIEKRLSDKYSNKKNNKMLLVDIQFMEDSTNNIWQGAWLGVADKTLMVLGEAREKHIDIGSIESIYISAGPNGNGQVTAINYNENSAPNWLIVRVLGTPDIGLPSTTTDLKNHIVNIVESTGTESSLEKRVKVRYIWKRIPLAIVMLFGIALLAFGIMKILNISDRYTPIISSFTAFIAINSLKAWITEHIEIKEEKEETSIAEK